jgi:UPF0716 protein FxsA
MNVAKWLSLTLLALPFLELAAFVAVAAAIGFGWALGLVIAGSLAGAWMLHSAGATHIGRVRVALGEGSFTALQADSNGSLVLLAGILLLIPGFITDIIALFVLAALLRRTLRGAQPPRGDGIVDLAPEQWRQVPEPSLPDHANRRAGPRTQNPGKSDH